MHVWELSNLYGNQPKVSDRPIARTSRDWHHHVRLFMQLTVDSFHISGGVEALHRGFMVAIRKGHLVVVNDNDSLRLLKGAPLL